MTDASATTPHDVLHVAVTSDRSLVAESVAAALGMWGVEAVVVGWPGSVPRALPDTTGDPGVGLLVCDLDSAGSLRAARQVLERRPPWWIVLTSAPRGPLWGAMGEAGAAEVMASRTGLATTVAALRRLAEGRLVPDADLVDRQAVWRVVGPDVAVVTGRLALLGAREVALLRELHGGLHVHEVADVWGVPVDEVVELATRMLGQLHVATLAQAVEAWDTVVDGDPGRGA